MSGFTLYGLLQAEHDPVLGYDARYSVSAGLGYRVVRSDALSVDLQGGPASAMSCP